MVVRLLVGVVLLVSAVWAVVGGPYGCKPEICNYVVEVVLESRKFIFLLVLEAPMLT